MKTFFSVLVLFLLAVPSIVAQEKRGMAITREAEPLESNFFPPELLMRNQKALGLTEDQKSVIKSEIQKAQTKFTDLEWQLKTETESMEDILKNDKVDEQQAIAQLEKVMGLEREVKKTQVTLMLRIKNKLSVEQQQKLRQIREFRYQESYMRERREKEEREMMEKREMDESQMRENREKSEQLMKEKREKDEKSKKKNDQKEPGQKPAA